MKKDKVIETERKHALLAEEDILVRENLRRLLENCGYRVTVVEDGLVPYQWLLESLEPPADLLISSLMMPGMGAAELLLSLHDRGVACPPVLVTGCVEPEVVSAFLDEGKVAYRYLRKPFSDESLRGMIGV